MACFRFLPQSTLDTWSDEGKVDFQGDKIVETATKAEFKIQEAVRFVRVESGADTNKLLHRVKPIEKVKALGAEHYMTSVILGETVYEVVPGWLAEDPSLTAGAAVQKGPDKKYGGARNQEADALAKLLLDKLS